MKFVQFTPKVRLFPHLCSSFIFSSCFTPNHPYFLRNQVKFSHRFRDHNHSRAIMLSRLIVTQQPMLSMALSRSTFSKMPMRTQIIREFQQQGRETISRSERISQRKTTLRDRIMAPAGPKGNLPSFFS